MSAITGVAGIAWFIGAAIDVEKKPFSLSPWHDGAIVTACVASAILDVSAPLSVVAKKDSLSQIAKTSAQILVWLLTLVSLFWAGRIAAQLLLRADRRINDPIGTTSEASMAPTSTNRF